MQKVFCFTNVLYQNSSTWRQTTGKPQAHLFSQKPLSPLCTLVDVEVIEMDPGIPLSFMHTANNQKLDGLGTRLTQDMWFTLYHHLQALSKNGKVYGNGIMVGVQPCIDKVWPSSHVLYVRSFVYPSVCLSIHLSVHVNSSHLPTFICPSTSLFEYTEVEIVHL